MRFNQVILFILLTMVQTAAFAQIRPGDSLTVTDAVRITITDHPLIRQSAALLDAARSRTEASRSSLYPTADAELGYTLLTPIAELAFPGLGDFKLYPENNFDEHIAVQQTVYDFGRRDATIDLNSRKTGTVADNIAIVRAELAYQTVQTFYTILFLRQSSTVQEQQIDALGEHLVITQKRMQSGSATDYDVLTTQVRIAAARNRLFDLTNDMHKREAQFRRLLGLPAGADVLLRGSFAQTAVTLNEDSLIALALQRRCELKLARDAEAVAEAEMRVAETRDRPALNAAIVYGVKNGYIPNLDIWRGNLIFGLEAKIPIFNGFRTRNDMDEASANLRAAALKRADTERMIVQEVQQSVSDLRTTAEKLQTSDIQVDQAARALEMAKVRYDNGVITNLDLIDAETALAQAKLTQVDALKDYVIGSYSLKKNTGEEYFAVPQN